MNFPLACGATPVPSMGLELPSTWSQEAKLDGWAGALLPWTTTNAGLQLRAPIIVFLEFECAEDHLGILEKCTFW